MPYFHIAASMASTRRLGAESTSASAEDSADLPEPGNPQTWTSTGSTA
jgi:hypothetical protein